MPTVRIALASPPIASSLGDALQHVRARVGEAAEQGAVVVCFPEAYLPGLRGLDVEIPPFDAEDQAHVVRTVGAWARDVGIAVILGMEWHTEAGRHIGAAVLNADGALAGVQLKTQLDPAEEAHYVPGTTRRLFEIGGLRLGIAICHEGFRYPETVRWAARRGAHVVFHPHWTGSDLAGPRLVATWGSAGAPYYERAVMCRALENTIYVASVNVSTRFQESATAVLAPDGELLRALPYGTPGVLIADLDLDAATGLLASRYAPERYPSEHSPKAG
ncbi:MAG: carbon-nitrogen hydrolase family protein [Bacteroidota bacterium]